MLYIGISFLSIKFTIRIRLVLRGFTIWNTFYPILITKVSGPKFSLVEVSLSISNRYRGFSECIINHHCFSMSFCACFTFQISQITKMNRVVSTYKVSDIADWRCLVLQNTYNI